MTQYYIKCPDREMVENIIRKGYELGYHSLDIDLMNSINTFKSSWSTYMERTVIYFDMDMRIRYSSLTWLSENIDAYEEYLIVTDLFQDDDDFML